MTANTVDAPIWWLSCDVPGCTETSPTDYSEGAAINEAVAEEGWHTFGPGRHVCGRDDHAHDEAARRFAAELARDVAP